MMEYKLAELFDLQMGKTPSRNNPLYWNSNDNAWVSIADLSETDGKYVTRTKEFLTDKAVVESGIKKIPANTVIMSFKLSIGKVAITPVAMYSNEAIMAFIDKGIEKIVPDYLYYLFLHKNWNKGTNKAVMGITLNKKILSDTSIYLHSIEEQKAIIEILDKVTDLIAKRKSQLLALDDLIKARFVEMFGDLANPKCEWEKFPLVKMCKSSDDIKCGPFGTQLSKDEYHSTGIMVWEIPQINSSFKTKPTKFLTNEKAKELQAYSIIPGDIAMSRKGNVGKCALFPENYPNGIIHSDVLRIRVDQGKVNPCFMMHQFHYSRAILNQIDLVSHGAIMAGINVTKLKNIIVHLPPKNIQDDFSSFVSQIDKSKVVVQQSLEKAQMLFDSLMQQYFG